jgi:ERCC4-type nuclease
MDATIVLDVRERALISAMPEAATAQLQIGDVEIRISGTRVLVVERKTLADLAASIKDGRYREQKARLLANATCPVAFVVESAYGSFAFDDRMRGCNGIAPKTLQGAVISMTLSSRVVFTRDVADTVAFLRRTAERLARDFTVISSEAAALPALACDTRDEYSVNAACVSGIAMRKRDNLDVRSCFAHQLCQVPGVSAKLSTTLCAEFGSMAALYARLLPLSREQREAAFGDLPMLGKKKAATLVDFLFVDPLTPNSDPLTSTLTSALTSDPLTSDPLTSDPLTSDPLTSDPQARS